MGSMIAHPTRGLDLVASTNAYRPVVSTDIRLTGLGFRHSTELAPDVGDFLSTAITQKSALSRRRAKFCHFLYNHFVASKRTLEVFCLPDEPRATESSFPGFIPADIIEHLKSAVTVFGEAQDLEGSGSSYAEIRDPE